MKNRAIFKNSDFAFCNCSMFHDLSQYLGEWYEVERYFAWFEFGAKCVTANYSLNEDNSMKIINKQISSL